MAERPDQEEQQRQAETPPGQDRQGARPASTGTQTRPAPAKPTQRHLPRWKVLLHNDDVNDMLHVVQTIVMLTPLSEQDAELRMREAHETGLALLLTTHQERAELYVQQFASRNLTVTVEPEE